MAKGLRVAAGTHQKTPDEVTAFSLDFSSALVTGETVQSVTGSTIEVDGTAGLVIDSTQVVTPLVNVVVSSGVAGSRYLIEIQVSTNLGQTLEGVVKVAVRERTTVASFLSVQDDDGSVADANGYVTVAAFRTYSLHRCRSVDAYDEDQIEAAIVNATDYMDGRWNFIGVRLTSDQATEFPRRDLIDDQGYHITGVPDRVKEACYEYAFIALTQDLEASPTRDDRGRLVESKMEKVGPLTEMTKYVTGAWYDPPEYPVADRKLRGLIEPAGWAQRG